MASMLREVSLTGHKPVNVDALKSEIRQALINQKANACPIAVRLAWHAAGTYDKKDGSGGCNGGTIRFAPESSDPDNAGLSIVRDLLLPVKENHPEITHADLYAVAGAVAIEFLGGPKVAVNFGRTDDSDGKRCPMNGRLPDATKGPDHLRAVFGQRMGFSDREIVALSGAHTLGRCHRVRSGFDGPWTTHPLRFDNEYFTNLVNLEWRPKKWNGPPQFEDVKTGELMMLPTDMALIQDAKFRVWVEAYAKDEKLWFADFAQAYAKLLSLGCPEQVQPHYEPAAETVKDRASAEFREHAMHGSVLAAKKVAAKADIHQVEHTSGRSALHKAAFWGHNEMTRYLVETCKLNVNLQDVYGDTPLHDAAKFGHEEVAAILLAGGANPSIKNKAGKDAMAVATLHGKSAVIAQLKKGGAPRSKL